MNVSVPVIKEDKSKLLHVQSKKGDIGKYLESG